MTKLEQAHRALRWLYEHGVGYHPRPLWIQQTFDEAYRPVREGAIKKGEYPSQDMHLEMTQ